MLPQNKSFIILLLHKYVKIYFQCRYCLLRFLLGRNPSNRVFAVQYRTLLGDIVAYSEMSQEWNTWYLRRRAIFIAQQHGMWFLVRSPLKEKKSQSYFGFSQYPLYKTFWEWVVCEIEMPVTCRWKTFFCQHLFAQCKWCYFLLFMIFSSKS